MRAWFAVGSWAVALCAIVLVIGSASTSAAQAAGSDDPGAPGGAGEEGASPDAAGADPIAAPAEAQDEQGEGDEGTEPADEQPPAVDSEGAATELGGTPTALQPGDVEAEAAAEAGDEEQAEDVQAAREPLPWRNTFFSWTHGVTPNSFIRDAQASYNPLYYWSFNLAPRWYIDPATFFFVSQSLSYELTDDDSATYNHDLQLSDTIVELRRIAVLEGFIFIPGVRVLLPASKASQAAQRYLALGGGLTAVRVVPEAASLTVALIGRYQYWFAGRNTPATMGSYEAEGAPNAPPVVPNAPLPNPEGVIESPTLDQASGSTSARHVITAGLSVTVTPVSGLTVGLSAFWLASEGHGLADACFESPTTPGGWICMNDMSPTHWRHATSLSLSVAYDITPWFNLAVGWSNSSVAAPFFAGDGSVLGPFNPDNNLFLTASFQIDAIYEALQGAEDDGLTPEQRQRRRQGLSRRISGEEGSF